MNLAPELEASYNKFITTLNEMQRSLEERLPDFQTQLQRLNVLLLAQPELGNILDDKEIGALMKGVIANSGVQFTIGGKGKSKVKFTADDLDNLEL